MKYCDKYTHEYKLSLNELKEIYKKDARAFRALNIHTMSDDGKSITPYMMYLDSIDWSEECFPKFYFYHELFEMGIYDLIEIRMDWTENEYLPCFNGVKFDSDGISVAEVTDMLNIALEEIYKVCKEINPEMKE